MYNPCIKTHLFGKKVIYLPSCHSTNDIAAEMLQNDAISEGSVVITDNQLNGKGQRNNAWESEKGKNFTFSLVMKPAFLKPHEQFLISQTVALGLFHYLSSKTDENVRIKWPNDLLLNSRKICGTLIENGLRGSGISHSIAGIGLNMNQTVFQNPLPVSLKNITGSTYDLQEEFPAMMEYLEKYYLILSEDGKDIIHQNYLRHLAGIGEKRLFSSGDEVFLGEITGTSSTGRLIVGTETGLREFDVKEIRWLEN